MSEKFAAQRETSAAEIIYTEVETSGGRRDDARQGTVAPFGASRRHNLIGSNTTIAIGSRVRGHKCEVYVNDMRVRLAEHTFCYPDVVVVAGEPAFEGTELDILVNPTVIVEIMSRATLAHDKTDKLEHYLSLESVKEILLVKEEEMRVEHYHKQTLNNWHYKIYNKNDDVVGLESINCKINLSEIYSQIRFG